MVTPTNLIKQDGNHIEITVEMGPMSQTTAGTIGGDAFPSQLPIGDKYSRSLGW